MVCSIMNFHHWTPETIDKLEMNDSDYKGLEFQFNNIKDYIKQIKNPK